MNTKAWVGITLVLLGGSMTGMAYVHSTFVPKETMEIVLDKLVIIENDVKILIGKIK